MRKPKRKKPVTTKPKTLPQGTRMHCYRVTDEEHVLIRELLEKKRGFRNPYKTSEK